ncbi:MAG: hypothetical protein KF790_06425 [Steroidobacteraceae bacterium]|nr:hypothetical protein [Steroidobacteraceae bacterium]MCW5571553.1 hypothetical protein [Steroidobacteraceae bacterium]
MPSDDRGLASALRPVTAEAYGGDYTDHALRQYQLYVEMTDRVSNRRMLANSFFVGMNTAVVGALAFALKAGLIVSRTLVVAPASAAILMCIAWWMMVLSYRQLNAGKFRVILAMEQRLPLAPYTAEWQALDASRSRREYLQTTRIELLVPWLFAGIHVALSIAILVRAF